MEWNPGELAGRPKPTTTQTGHEDDDDDADGDCDDDALTWETNFEHRALIHWMGHPVTNKSCCPSMFLALNNISQML